MLARPALLYVLALPFGAALAHADNLRIGGFNYSGFLWLMFLAVGAFIILSENKEDDGERVPFPCTLWLPWVGWLCVSLVWRDSPNMKGVQDALQISMPVLIAGISSMFVRSERDLEWLFRAFFLTVPILLLQAVAARLGLIGEEEQGHRVLALNTALVGCVFAARYPTERLLPILGWGACVVVTVITGSRTATAVLLLAPALHPGYKHLVMRSAIVVGLCAAGVGLFYTQTFQERFFASGSGTLSDVLNGDVLDFGRLEVWPFVWRESLERPLLGHGVGSAYDYMPTIWPDMYQVHNDYLRIIYETGFVGLVLFSIAVLGQLYSLFVNARRETGWKRAAASAGFIGMIIFLMTSATDNTLIYNLAFMNPLFAVIGGLYGAQAGAAATSAARRGAALASLTPPRVALPPDSRFRRGWEP